MITINFTVMPETLLDKNLIQQYLKGDEKSLELLINKYLKQIYGFVYKSVGSVADAEDITQDVFVKAWRNIRKFDQKRDFKPWVFQIAKNASIDYLRKKRSIPFSRFENEKGQNVLIESIAAKPQNLIGSISDKKTLGLILSTLSPEERKIIDLRHNEGMSFKEIAEIFEESINTVKSRYRRVIMGLKNNAKK